MKELIEYLERKIELCTEMNMPLEKFAYTDALKKARALQLQQTGVMWRFCAYKSENDYKRGIHYFEKYFTDHTEMKVFSAKHSASEKPRFPNYVSMYWRSENAT